MLTQRMMSFRFGYCLSLYLGEDAPGVKLESLVFFPWINPWTQRLHFILRCEKFGFENPPGFPNPYFASAKSITMKASISWAGLWNLRKVFTQPDLWGEKAKASCRPQVYHYVFGLTF